MKVMTREISPETHKPNCEEESKPSIEFTLTLYLLVSKIVRLLAHEQALLLHLVARLCRMCCCAKNEFVDTQSYIGR